MVHLELEIAAKLVAHRLTLSPSLLEAVVPTHIEPCRQYQRLKLLGRRIREKLVMQRSVVAILEEQAERVLAGPIGIAAGGAMDAQTRVQVEATASVGQDQLRRGWPLPKRTIGLDWIRIRVDALVLAEQTVNVAHN